MNIKRNGKKMTDEQKQLVIDYQTVFDTEFGKRVYEDLTKWSGYNDRIIPQGVPDMTAFELGRRDMFLHIKDKLDANPDDEVQTESESEAEDEQV